MVTAYGGLIYQRENYDGQIALSTFEFDSKLKAFFRFFCRFCVNTVLALGLALLGYTILAILRETGHPPKLIQKYFLIYFLPSVVGMFLLFGFADQVCFRLRLYTTSHNSLIESSERDSVTDYDFQKRINPSKRPSNSNFTGDRLQDCSYDQGSKVYD